MSLFRIRTIKSRKGVNYPIEEQLAYNLAHGVEDAGFWIDVHRLFAATSDGDEPVEIKGECQDYLALMEGLNPDDRGQMLRGGSRDPVDQQKLLDADDRVFGLDCVLSAPRGVSLLYACGDEKTRRIVLDEWKAALDAAVAEISENYIWARRGHGGVDKERGKAVMAAFLHKAARPTETGSVSKDAGDLSKAVGYIGDPHLHYHIIIPSYVQRSDGSFVTMDTNFFGDGAIKAIGKAASLRLAEGLRTRLGVDMEEVNFVQPDGSVETILDVAGMREHVERSSARSAHANKKMAEKIAADPSIKDNPQRMKALHQQVLLDQRLGKNTAVQGPEGNTLFREEAWAKRLKQDGFDLEAIVNRPKPDVDDALDLDDQTEQAITLAFESEGILSTGHLHQALYKAHLIHGTRESAMATKARLIETGRLIELGLDGKQGWTTRTQVETEEKVRVLAAELVAEPSNRFQIGEDRIAAVLARSYQAATAIGFQVDDLTREEQARALRHLVSTTAMIAVMEGAAGTGKSHVFSLASELYRAEGKEMIALALAHETAHDLGQKCNCPATAIDAFLSDLAKGKRRLTAETVIMVDEAGQVGARQMKELLEAANAAGAKIMLTGDRLQVKPVSAGGGLDLVVREAGSVRLENSVRATEIWAREAASLLSQGRGEEAIQLFHRAGRVHLVDGPSLAAASRATREAALAGRYSYAADIVNDGKTHLVMSATNAGVEQMATTIRQQMIESGALGTETLTIRAIDRDEQKRRKGKIRRRKSDPDQEAPGRRRGRQEPRKDLEIRLGEQLRFGRRDDRLGVVNGTAGQVVGWGPNDDGVLRLLIEVKGVVDRTIHLDPVEYGYLRHNYASTVYSAQGATVGYAGVVIDGESWKRDAAYVAGSRARDETHFFVNRRELERQMKENLPIEQRRGFRASDKELLLQLGANLSRVSKKDNATDWLDRPMADSWEEAERRWIPARVEGEKRDVPEDAVLRRQKNAEKRAEAATQQPPAKKPEPAVVAKPAGVLPVAAAPSAEAKAPTERRKRGRPRKNEAGEQPSAKKLLSFPATGNRSVKNLKMAIANRPTLRAKLLPIVASIAPRRIDHATLHASGHIGPGLALTQAVSTEAATKAAITPRPLPALRRQAPARAAPRRQQPQAELSPAAVEFAAKVKPEQLEVALRTNMSGLLNLAATAKAGGEKAAAARAQFVQVRERVQAVIDRVRAERPDAIERLSVAFKGHVEQVRPAPKAKPAMPGHGIKALALATRRHRLAKAVEKIASKLFGANSYAAKHVANVVRALAERVGVRKARVQQAAPESPAIKGPTLKGPSI